MIEVKREVSGSIVYWTLGDSYIDKLKAKLQPLGKDNLIPGREGVLVMREAIPEVYPQKQYLVRKTQTYTKLEIVEETKGDGKNKYGHVLTVDTNDLTNTPQPLVDAYKRRQSVLPASQTAQMLLTIVRQLHGVTLRESGGFYWIPSVSVGEFKKVATAIEESAVGINKMYSLTTELDVPTVCSIKDSLTDEITTEATRIITELSQGIARKDAIEHRRNKARQMMDKVHQYEGLLSSSLEELRNSVEQIEIAAVAAELATAQEKELVNA